MDLEQIIKSVLEEHYLIETESVVPMEGGWSALAYRATDVENRKFLVKVYDKSRTSTAQLTARIKDYMPIVCWLNAHTALSGKIVHPLTTEKGEYSREDEHHIYLVGDYIEGNNLLHSGFSIEQILQLADIVAELHAYGEEIPLPTGNIKEDFNIRFSKPLLDILAAADSCLKEDLRKQIAPYMGTILGHLKQLTSLADQLKDMPLRYVLCHTDIHEGNLLQCANRLSLIDWEGLRLAPPEADLFFLADKPWFHLFYGRYKEKHVDFTIHQTLLRFYQEKRILEDIWEFMEQLQSDDMSPKERAAALNYLQKECGHLRHFAK